MLEKRKIVIKISFLLKKVKYVILNRIPHNEHICIEKD